MALAGINVLIFYFLIFGTVTALDLDDGPPWAAKIIGPASLLCWIGVITSGRLLTFYRPPWHWCPWC